MIGLGKGLSVERKLFFRKHGLLGKTTHFFVSHSEGDALKGSAFIFSTKVPENHRNAMKFVILSKDLLYR